MLAEVWWTDKQNLALLAEVVVEVSHHDKYYIILGRRIGSIGDNQKVPGFNFSHVNRASRIAPKLKLIL